MKDVYRDPFYQNLVEETIQVGEKQVALYKKTGKN